MTVARATGDALQTHRDPDGEPWWVLANPGPGLGERVVAVVDDSGSDWRVVASPVRPNGTTGWVRRADVEVVTFSARIEVDLTDRRLLAWIDGDLVADTPVAIGAEDSPTPTGTFHVIHVEEFVDPDPVFGRWLVGTSGFSEVLPAIDGGAPAVAIHAAVDPSVLGDAVSLGCLRVPEEVAAVLAGLPLGTTVVISG